MHGDVLQVRDFSPLILCFSDDFLVLKLVIVMAVVFVLFMMRGFMFMLRPGKKIYSIEVLELNNFFFVKYGKSRLKTRFGFRSRTCCRFVFS